MPHPALSGRWEQGVTAFGGWLTTDSESTLDIFGRVGYDYVGIDTQHTVLNDAQAAVLIRRCAHANFAVVVRVATNQPALIGRVLDAGADGVIVPMVSTPAEARAAVGACRYPPEGVRSFGPMRGDMGLEVSDLQNRVSCFVMIETAEGLANVDEICAVPGLGGVYIGPADLSIGLGMNPMLAFSTDQLRDAVESIAAACDKHGVIMGAHSLGGVNAAQWAARGARFVSVGADVTVLAAAVAQELKTARGETGGPAEAANPWAG
jgi:2-keto-3-deoxy-L-rhamnonate aldolase RhmA